MLRGLFTLAALLILPATGQDGGQLYLTYCGACHAEDGKGATGGQFPPLAGSEWLQGKPERAIQVVLHGLEGPVEVKGRTYNLLMPPQGAAVPDDQIAAVLTYARSAWGNKEGKVTPDMIKKARAESTKRDKPWTQEELLKKYPLPKRTSALQNLTSRIYHGQFKDLPDFSKLEARNIEEEHDGLISVEDADRENQFGLVWEGDFVTDRSGEHSFQLGCDDGGRVVINGRTVTEVRGLGPLGGNRAKTGKINLKKGRHPIRIEYYEFSGQEGITLSWKGPGKDPWKHLSKQKPKRDASSGGSMLVKPTGEKAAIYRNFIANTTPRAIGIGFPGGVNMAYSADHLAPELVWQGDFIDGGRHWRGRGQGNQAPAGEDVVKLTDKPVMPEAARFRGYELDAAGNPTFRTSLHDLLVEDTYRASNGKLTRVISAEGGGEPGKILLATATGDPEGTPEKPRFLLRGVIEMEVEAPSISREGNNHYVLLAPGQSATVTYSWAP